MVEKKKTVGERKPFSRLLGASAWHLISRWELLTFRWPSWGVGRYLVFAFPAFVPRPTGRIDGRGTGAQWIAWITSEYLIIQLTCWQTGAAGLQQSRRSFFTVGGMDLSRFRSYQLGRGRGSGYACYCSISRPAGEIMPRFDEICRPRSSLLRTLGLFRWKESVGVNNSIRCSRAFPNRNVS